MCSDPITTRDTDGKELTFACRVCNECISARKNDWVVRAMAEKATSGETIALELTYRNDGEGVAPDAAKAFKYNDVAAFLKRLRQEYYRTYDARGEIRFICAGERGSQKGRVHWHMVIFADRPFSHLAKWSDFAFKPLKGPEFSELGRKAKMLHWSIWDHGHVVVKRPDQGGMQYVLKYALKDQFNVVKSKGTMRESKSENHGASKFNMSKQPPIGFRFLERLCNRWQEKGVVPPALNIKVPDYSGFWYPKGKLREYLLMRLWAINEERKERYGRDCPQWSTLLASLESVEKDWEALVYGPEEEEAETFNVELWRRELATQQSAREKQHRQAEIRRNCGGVRVCRLCWRGKSSDARKRFQGWFAQQVQEYITDEQSFDGTLDQWFRQKGVLNPHCIPAELEQSAARESAR